MAGKDRLRKAAEQRQAPTHWEDLIDGEPAAKNKLPKRQGWSIRGNQYTRTVALSPDIAIWLDSIAGPDSNSSMNALIRRCILHTKEDIEAGRYELPIKEVRQVIG